MGRTLSEVFLLSWVVGFLLPGFHALLCSYNLPLVGLSGSKTSQKFLQYSAFPFLGQQHQSAMPQNRRVRFPVGSPRLANCGQLSTSWPVTVILSRWKGNRWHCSTGDAAETNTVAVFPWVIMQFRAVVLERGTCGSVWRYFGLSQLGVGAGVPLTPSGSRSQARLNILTTQGSPYYKKWSSPQMSISAKVGETDLNELECFWQNRKPWDISSLTWQMTVRFLIYLHPVHFNPQPCQWW